MMSPARDDTPRDADEGKPVVLVVEDEVLVRMVIADYLRGCGYLVIEAGNAQDAVALFEAEVHIDIVFSDVQMPGDMDGFGLARWVRAHRPGTEVILTSGIRKTAEAAGDLCEEGPFLAKPYEPTDVQRRIGTLLSARQRVRLESGKA